MSNNFMPVMGPVYYHDWFPKPITNQEHSVMLIVDATHIASNELGERNMGGSYGHYDHGLVQRDAKLAKLRSRLSLAERSRNKTEITRLSKEIKILGQGW